MLITEISIRNFRSLKSLSWNTQSISLICGVNSCGKSNILRAIKFAFLRSFEADRVAENFCHATPGGNAEIRIKIKFDKPTPAIAAALGISPMAPFTYEIKVKRNASSSALINGVVIDATQRGALLANTLIVYVPPLRDISTDGLAPFRQTLMDALSKMKGTKSFGSQALNLKNVIREKSKKLLSSTQGLSTNQLRVDELVVDTDALDFKMLVPKVGIKFKAGSVEATLDKLGTGHQSAVVLELYRQLGEETGAFTLYLFEEPDNHLHPTSLRAIAEDLKKCAKSPDSQVFLTTHSASLLNQFSFDSYLPLTADVNRITARVKAQNPRGDRQMRDAFGRFGLTPAEALLSKRVLIVEGANDVTLFRTLIEIQTGCTADRQDILVVSAGGKAQVTELAAILNELGVNWGAAFDWDAVFDTRLPALKKGLSAALKANLKNCLSQVVPHLAPISPKKQSKAQKLVDSLIAEIDNPGPPHVTAFRHSELGRFLTKIHSLSTPQLNTVENAINSKSAVQYRPQLGALDAWIWSDSPEEVLLKHASSEGVVEQAMINDLETPLTGPIPLGPAKHSQLFNYIHGLANRPEQMALVVRDLHAAGALNRKEIREAVQFSTR